MQSRLPASHLVMEDRQRDGGPREPHRQAPLVVEPLRGPRRVHERRELLPAHLRQPPPMVDGREVPHHLLQDKCRRPSAGLWLLLAAALAIIFMD